MDLPKRIIQRQHEAESYAILLYKLRDLGIFRNLTENDYGIDFEIELVKDNKLTGKYIKVQVKSSEDLRIRKKDKVPTISGIKQSTLYYWSELSFSTNVLVYAVDLSNENIYLTRPVFWQATQLIDRSDSTKTIEFLPVTEYHAEIAGALTYAFAWAPTIREHIYFHIDALRHLKQFLELYLDVFHYDAHMPIHEPETFRHFLELCQNLLWYKSGRVSEKFPEEDRDHFYSFKHWERKTEHGELYNYICQSPMKILLPEFLDQLSTLRQRVLNGSYYWLHKNIPYLRQVFCYEIPTERDHDQLCTIEDQYEMKYLKPDWEFDQYRYSIIRAEENGS